MSSGNVNSGLEQARALLPAADTAPADEPTMATIPATTLVMLRCLGM